MGRIREITGVEAKALAKKKAEAQDLAQWEDIREEMPDIPDLVAEDFKLRTRIKEDEERREEIKPLLEAAVIIGGKKSLICNEYKITQGSGRSRDFIAPERIVEKAVGMGLTADQVVELLEFATIKGSPYTYPLVTKVGG